MFSSNLYVHFAGHQIRVTLPIKMTNSSPGCEKRLFNYKTCYNTSCALHGFITELKLAVQTKFLKWKTHVSSKSRSLSYFCLTSVKTLSSLFECQFLMNRAIMRSDYGR